MHIAILFIGPPKPDVCWDGRSHDKCEEFIFTMIAYHGVHLNQTSYGYKPRALTIELFRYPPSITTHFFIGLILLLL